ncbi:helix-turn-helix domain-containing protein [Pelomonas aquatica]|jgi:AraC-like DNA-binding protein|uniref:AraC family transcriptional regulator n=1 Tax=Pelomonas aquatica TaxID=431058 RepID=A0A9X4LHH5_9BURK|nr:helix-turn-helix transcriptional regulator [Pelomonas aquatica]MDG0863283.1 AraC family transcriptional regulator [Pelomonas aquatica]
MSDQGLAYHTVVSAMRDRSRGDPKGRFALAIKAAVSGHVAHIEYRRAAAERRAQGWSEDTVARAVYEWLQTDLNPAVQSIRAARSREAVVGLYNVYNRSVPLGVRTEVHEGGTRRMPSSVAKDDELCAAGSLAVVGWIGRDVASKAARPPEDWMISGWRAARYLGAERQASAEVARLLEADGDMDLRTLAASLGSSARTLQRQIAAEGLSLTELRMACRQTVALRLIQAGEGSLGQVASLAGFADQAHMARAFKAASGLTPGQIARMLAA